METEGKKHKNLYLLGASRNQISVLYSGGVGGWYRKKKYSGLARSQGGHLMDLFVSCQLPPLSRTPFTADESSSVPTERARVAPGGL